MSPDIEVPEIEKRDWDKIKIYVQEKGAGTIRMSQWSDNYICELEYLIRRIALMTDLMKKYNFTYTLHIKAVQDNNLKSHTEKFQKFIMRDFL